jgi:hypothetical protein
MKPEYAAWRAVMLDSLSRFRSKSLFWELRNIDRSDVWEPLFTIKDKPHTVPTFDKKGLVTYPSLKQIYMSYDHIPGHEYEFAMDVFGSWKHWDHLATQSSLQDMLQEWRDELAIKIKAEAIRNMMMASKESSTVGVNASRYLADEGYIPKKVGRITKEEKIKQAKIAAGVRDTLSEDMERLGISVIQGNK